MKRTQGFTVIEIIAVVLFLATATVLLFIQRENLTATTRDDKRKISINAMYYNLEEVYFAKNKYYPSTISSDVLTAMDTALFTDPNGNALGTASSNYRYEPTNCDNDKCKSYTLRADLEKEDDYIKTNRSN
jgi:type II secretory pathway pseudopilin PulG